MAGDRGTILGPASCLRPLACTGVAGDSGVLRQAIPREVVKLGLPRRGIPPGTSAPLRLCLLQAPTSPTVDLVHLKGQDKSREQVRALAGTETHCEPSGDITRHDRPYTLAVPWVLPHCALGTSSPFCCPRSPKGHTSSTTASPGWYASPYCDTSLSLVCVTSDHLS